jgi:chromate transporter
VYGPAVRDVFLSALRLGLTSFGGPIAHIGYFRREYVERLRWFDDREFGDLLALCQSLPGPASSQLGIAIGTIRAGIGGGIVAWLAFTLPSAAALVVFAALASSSDAGTAGWVHGLKLAAVAVVAQAVIALAKALAPDWRRRLLAAAAAAVVLLWQDPLAQLAVVLGGAATGMIMRPAPEAVPVPTTAADATGPSRRTALAALAVLGGLLVALAIAGGLTRNPAIGMVDALFRTGSLVFGGGHVVLPLLHGGVVEPGWVPEDRFLSGYGAAQAVPGPLFSFAAYLGAVAAPLGGIGGAVVALVAIYVPSFLLVVGVLPFWGSLRRSLRFRSALTGTNAAVVGLLAAALYHPVWTGSVTSAVDVSIVILAFAALGTGRVPPILVVFLTAGAGQLLNA